MARRDDARSEQFGHAQHAGSLGPAQLFAKRYNLSSVNCPLDVAGGSGAFNLTLCKRNPALHATILDFPNMTRVAGRYASEAGLANRISMVSGNAFEIEWPRDQDAVLLTPGTLGERASEAGFAQVGAQEFIPELTKVLTATKPR
jgi:hypothetical protein